jgi:raffinose/stachyose/melibiose transport system permease protein
MLKTRAWTPYAYIAPALLLIGFIFAYPVAQVFNFSFRLIRGNSGPWVGFNNYRLIFDDPTFVAAAKHSAILLLAVPVLLAISIIVSVLLFERARGWKLYRSVLFFPYILAVAVVGIVASYIFQLNGVLNEILRGIGLGGPDWLGDDQLALATLMLVIVWREVGFGIVLFLARLLSLPEEQIEAARIDGAGWWQRLRHVILPELRGTIEFYCVVAAITVLAWVFGYVFTLTRGGPGDATQVLELYIYNQGLRNSLPGMASAVAVLLMGVTMIFVALLFWARSRSREEETS